MFKFNKKVYYKYFDLWRLSSFLGDESAIKHASRNMQLIDCLCEHNLSKYSASQLQTLGFDEKSSFEICQFKETKKISAINTYLGNIEEWIKDIILPDFLDIDYLRSIFQNYNIKTKDDLLCFFQSSYSIRQLGIDNSELYAHFVLYSGGNNFPKEYALSYTQNDKIIENISSQKIRGNFHNHSTFSDGRCTIQQLAELAQTNGREYIGISDHTKQVSGISDADVECQHSLVDELNAISSVRILKGVECEILLDGSLDLSEESLMSMDYVIAAIHHGTAQIKKDAEHRLIKALENPYTCILAHPSARLYKKKVELLVDMKKIIDACVANNVAIEINGDPDRLDLDPSYIEYAVNKGAYFTLDSDTHSTNGFWNINNAIKIAHDKKIPAESCLNTFNIKEVIDFFKRKQK